jgi:uncharacterized protein (DUF983 family)
LSAPSSGRPPWIRSLARAARHLCPRCGDGPLFRGYGRLRERCPRCGLVYRREQGAQTGSMYLSAAVTQVFAAVVIALVWLGTDWGVVRSIAVTLPVVALFCFAFLPYSQALWVAVEFVTDVINAEPWVAPDSREARDERRPRSRVEER